MIGQGQGRSHCLEWLRLCWGSLRPGASHFCLRAWQAGMAAAAADLFTIAMRWEAAETTTEERERLKATVSRIVGYRARVACDPHNGIVDILVQNPAKSESDVADMLELQPSGAFGVIWDEYPMARRARVVETACNT